MVLLVNGVPVAFVVSVFPNPSPCIMLGQKDLHTLQQEVLLEQAPEAKQRSNGEVIKYQRMEEMLLKRCKSTDRWLPNDKHKMELVRTEMR